ncbi:RNA/RNP complex-1-interacting phosphatase-like [Cololabis saira]|uniref:RNA/RNP complex-1-interacting phosphatase-like n=1 Tax=Cololabis saira TaxID=129043 RepID=UPI002AD38DBB|nr:RNA/RNP complex-1-interacting phosphatase-like [Cololabis saira]
MSGQRSRGRKNGVPDRWLDYTAVGRRLDGTRFIAFKVPLKQSLKRQLLSSDAFGPWDLLDTLHRHNQDLGLIVDLTFTTRYYSLQDIPDSLTYVKIFTTGHEVPSNEVILSFKRTVYRFLRENKENDKLIGVHCTHGLNRTGYLICRYLIDVDGMDPEDAVKLFNSSRGHPIERQNYLLDLQHGPKRSNKGIMESEHEPMRGQAVYRPTDDEQHCDESGYHRSLPPRGLNSRLPHNWHRPHHNRLLPYSPVIPPLPPLRQYRPEPPLLNSQWRRHPGWEDEWCRTPRSERGPPILPRYSANWTTSSNDVEADDWTCPRMRPSFRYTQRHPDP